jgi:drug/metabolite transporter (DMT)-like permease
VSNLVRGAIFGLGAAAIWGGMYVVSDLVLHVIPPFALLSIRLMISSLLLGGILYFAKRCTALPRPTLLAVLGIGLVGFGISLGAQFVGTDRSTAVNGALITSASPAFILIFAALLLHERLTAIRIVAVVVATIGVIIVINPANADFGSETFFGDLMLAVAAITWGLYSVLVRRISGQVDTLVLSFLAPLGGLLLTIPATAFERQSHSIGEITPGIIFGVLYLGIISTAVAMWMWNRAFALVDASTASLFFFAQPLVGAALSVLILGQVMTMNLLVGGVFIAVGVLISLLGEKPHG